MLARISNYFETFSSQEYPLPDSEKDKLDDYFNKNIVNSKNDKGEYYLTKEQAIEENQNITNIPLSAV